MTSHVFIPIFRLKGTRYRIRMRLVRPWRFWAIRDPYPEGAVFRVRLGWLLVVAMMDRG